MQTIKQDYKEYTTKYNILQIRVDKYDTDQNNTIQNRINGYYKIEQISRHYKMNWTLQKTRLVLLQTCSMIETQFVLD